MNETMCQEYENSLKFVFHVTRFIPSGHPGLDFFSDECEAVGPRSHVIYAPHFSFPNPKFPDYAERLSTFDWNGREILAYAKLHPEMNWVFKPHPLLREWVLSSGFMDEKELNDYFSAWAEIGLVCEDGNYQGLFLQSRVMITDSGSFLTEFGATGMPIIHLICNENKLKPIAAVKPVWDTYYKVSSLTDMYSIFKAILEEGKDPYRDIRQTLVDKAGIRNSSASQEIIEYFTRLLEANA